MPPWAWATLAVLAALLIIPLLLWIYGRYLALIFGLAAILRVLMPVRG